MTPLQIALAELNTTEIKGSEHNDRILHYANVCGLKNVIHTDETPWCGTFVGFCLIKSDLKIPKNPAMAKSYLNIAQYGAKRVVNPIPSNTLVVFHRGNPKSWKGHVAWFLGFNYDASKVFVVGGNQGNKVSIAAYDVDLVADYILVGDVNEYPIPDAPLTAQSNKEDIINMQYNLNLAGFSVGENDGVYGEMTKNGIKQLQRQMTTSSQIDGMYTKEVQKRLTELLMS